MRSTTTRRRGSAPSLGDVSPRGATGSAMPRDKVSITQPTPLLFLERSAGVFPTRVAVSYGDRRMTYAELAADAQRLAAALGASGIRPGDRVAYLLPNVPEYLVAHFAVPLAHAVLVAIN